MVDQLSNYLIGKVDAKSWNKSSSVRHWHQISRNCSFRKPLMFWFISNVFVRILQSLATKDDHRHSCVRRSQTDFSSDGYVMAMAVDEYIRRSRDCRRQSFLKHHNPPILIHIHQRTDRKKLSNAFRSLSVKPAAHDCAHGTGVFRDPSSTCQRDSRFH